MARQSALPKLESAAARPSRGGGSALAVALGTGLAYYLGALAGVHGAVMPEGIAILWPPNALLLAVLLQRPRSGWWACFPAIVAGEMAADWGSFSPRESLAFAAINFVEALLIALLLQALFSRRFEFRSFRHVLVFAVVGVALVPALAALPGALVYSMSRGDQTSFLSFWRIWWFGDALGLLVVTPAAWAALEWWSGGCRRPPLTMTLTAAVLLLATALLAWWVFAADARDLHRYPVTPFILMPITALTAARCGFASAAWGGLLLAMISIGWTTLGSGPYSQREEIDAAIALQEYLTITVFSALALAVLVGETQSQQQRARESEDALRQLNQQLEQRVAERTAELTVANRELERLAVSDGLTGALNRRRFIELAAQELERARRYGRPLALVLWDLDHFKRINDCFGHLAGDAVLCAAVQRAQRLLRSSDILARYGGEEFVVLLPDTELEAAIRLAERIRLALCQSPLETGQGSIAMSASMGVTVLREEDAGVDDLIGRADLAMYVAKDAGRNRVESGA